MPNNKLNNVSTHADMKVDQLAQAQVAVAVQQQLTAIEGGVPAGAALAPGALGGLYAGLGLEEFLDYGGLNISAGAVQQQMPGVRADGRVDFVAIQGVFSKGRAC